MELVKKPSDLTDCWNDEQRMNFLFSAFPPDPSHNPAHWKSKLDFWRTLIMDLCVQNNRMKVTLDTVSSWVARDDRKPMGLHVVWEDLKQSKEFVPASEYAQDLSRNSTWLGWGLNWMVRKPTTWITGKVFSPLKGKGDLGSQRYICMKSLHKMCDLVLERVHQEKQKEDHPNKTYIYSYKQLQALTSDIVTGTDCLDLVILTLENKKSASVYMPEPTAAAGTSSPSNQVKRYIKFAAPSETTAQPVGEVDLGILELEESEKVLEKEITLLYKEQTKLVNLCRESIRNKQRVLAKNYLRKKRRLTVVLDKKDASLSNVQQLLERIHQCKTDMLVVETYKAGIEMYKKLKDEGGLNIDAVEDTMNDLGDMIAEQDDISSIMATPVSESEFSNDELEQELNDLLSEDISTPASSDLLSELESLSINSSTPSTPGCETKKVGEKSGNTQPVLTS
ncbi:charged multivesicular body protein 7-like [Ciona intestinalis]